MGKSKKRLPVLLIAFLSGCSGVHLAPSPPPPKIAVLSKLISTHCATCHDGQDGRPDLEGAALTRTVALQAALMISSGKMPPSPARLTESVRSDFISELCLLGAQDPNKCVKFYSPTGDVAWAREPLEFLRAIDSVVPRQGAAHPTEDIFGKLVIRATRIYALDPTLILLTVLLTERCATPYPAQTDAIALMKKCIKSMISLDLARIPPPVEISVKSASTRVAP